MCWATTMKTFVIILLAPRKGDREASLILPRTRKPRIKKWSTIKLHLGLHKPLQCPQTGYDMLMHTRGNNLNEGGGVGCITSETSSLRTLIPVTILHDWHSHDVQLVSTSSILRSCLLMICQLCILSHRSLVVCYLLFDLLSFDLLLATRLFFSSPFSWVSENEHINLGASGDVLYIYIYLLLLDLCISWVLLLFFLLF